MGGFLRCLVSLFILLSASRLTAQLPKVVVAIGANKIFGFDPSTGVMGKCEMNVYGNGSCVDTTNDNYIYSIARYQDTLYFNDHHGKLYRTTGALNAACTPLPVRVNSVALTVDADGNLLWVTFDDSLIRYNPHNGRRESLGQLNYAPGGDLIFYERNLLMSTVDGFLVQVNMIHPEQSTLFMDFGGIDVYGLANLSKTCTQTTILGFSFNDRTGLSDVLIIDLTAKKILGKSCSIDGMVLDAASEEELGGCGLSNTIFPGKDTVGCDGGSILLNAAHENVHYLWDDGSEQQTRAVDKAGKYWVTIDSAGCVASDTIHTSFSSIPPVSFSGDTDICRSNPLTLHAVGDNIRIIWQDSSTQSDYTVNETGLYTVDVRNFCGEQISSKYVSVEDCICQLYVPNAFSPNGDGINELFRSINRCPLNGKPVHYTLRVFNRYGQQVFSTRDPAGAWTGSANGSSQPSGTYIWEISFQNDLSSPVRHLQGSVELLR